MVSVSVRQRPFIMKLHANMYHVNKQPSLEEGSMRYETMEEDSNSAGIRKSNRCNRCLQLMKVILYLELILFIGWIGTVFIANYYQVRNHDGLDEQYGASEWSRNSESLDSTVGSNTVLPDAIKWSPKQEEIESTTVKSRTHEEFSQKNKQVDNDMETTTASSVVEPDDKDAESILLSRWLESLTVPKNTWDDSSSKSTSSEDKFDWGKSSDERSEFYPTLQRAATNENHFGAVDEDDEIDLNYLLTLPLWHNVVFTSDYVDNIENSDKDSFQEEGIAQARLLLANSDSLEHLRSRQARSTTGQNEDSSSSSSSEESTPTHGKSHSENAEASDEDECPTIFDDKGNVIDEPEEIVNYISKNVARWLKETEIPECEKPKTARSVTVDKCGKFVINCEIDELEDPPVRHHRHTRNAMKENSEEENCMLSIEALRQDLEAWRTKFVTGKPSESMVNDVYTNMGKYIYALIIQAIVRRTNDVPRRTDEEWHNSLLTMKENISNSMDSEHQNLLVKNSELTFEMGVELGKLVEGAVDIDMSCRDVSLTSSQARNFMTLLERERCHLDSENITSLETALAAEIVPGESTNSTVMSLRREFIARLQFSMIIKAERNRRKHHPSVLSNSVNVTDEQWILGLKQAMVESTKDPVLQKKLMDAPTQGQTNQLRKIADYYLNKNIYCSEIKLMELMGAFAGRRTRAVSVDPAPSIIVTCRLEDDDIQFIEERQERLDHYNQLQATNETGSRQIHFVKAIEHELNGTTPTENVDEKVASSFRRYLDIVDVFVGSSSSDLKNETYRLLRDIVLELNFMEDNETATEGYDIEPLIENWGTSCLAHIPENYTAETVLLAGIKASEALNLRYSGIEDGKTCADEYTPVYGTFTYVGEAPEKPIVRRWRHIFTKMVRLYFGIHNPEVLPKLQCTSNKGESQTDKPSASAGVNRFGKRSIRCPNRSAPCSTIVLHDRTEDLSKRRPRAVAADPLPTPTIVTCKLEDDDIQFGQERQERLDHYNQFLATNGTGSREIPFVKAIGHVLNGTAPTENLDDKVASTYRRYMEIVDIFVGNSSSDVKNEAYRLLRDIVLELNFMEDNETATEGYDVEPLVTNWATGCIMRIPENYTAETVLLAGIKAGEGLNLRYSGIEDGKTCADEYTPVYGTFTYVGEAPEKSIVRRWRHIFRESVRLYFRIHNPEALPKSQCTSNEEESQTDKPRADSIVNRLGKRSIRCPNRNGPCSTVELRERTEDPSERRTRAVAADPTPAHVACISHDDVIQFGQERKERLDRYSHSIPANTKHYRDLLSLLNAIEHKLNGTTPTENSDEKTEPAYRSYMNVGEVFAGNSSPELKNETYRLLRDFILELKYLDDNEEAAEGYEVQPLMRNWTTSCLAQIGDEFTAETVLTAIIKAGEALNLRYSGIEDGQNCSGEYTPAYGTFTYVGEPPEKSIVLRWKRIFQQAVKLYFRIHNPEALRQLQCADNEEESQTDKRSAGCGVNRLNKRSIGYPIRKSANSVNVDEKDFGSEDNGPLIKINRDFDTEPRDFDLSQNTFFNKMEMLSAHIDRLHEMYQKYNELNDDYVSKEFPVDMSTNY